MWFREGSCYSCFIIFEGTIRLIMNKTPRLFQFWILCLVVFASLAQGAVSEQEYLQGMQQQKTVQPEAKQKVEVGVLAIRGHLYAEQRWQPTIDWLNQQISDVHFALADMLVQKQRPEPKMQRQPSKESKTEATVAFCS